VIKEGFAPELLASAISEFPITKNELVIDPFCGSGTLPLAASLRGYRSVGIEVNPFLAFAARTKTLSCDSDSLTKGVSSVLPAIRKGAISPLEHFSTFCEQEDSEKWLFNRAILRCFQGGWQAAQCLTGPASEIVKLMLVRAAMETCNAVADGKCLRYRKGWPSLRFGKADFIERFESWSMKAREDLREEPTVRAASIILGDARRVLEALDAGEPSLCVTSPPYLNSFDYSDVYRPETFLIGAVRSNHELRAVRLASLRSHVQVKWADPTTNDFGPTYEQTMVRLGRKKDAFWDSRLPKMVQAYFEDMRRVMKALKAVVRTRARLWLVVSTSAYAGIEVPVDSILAQIGDRVGWFLHDIVVLRHLRASGQHAVRVPGEEIKPFHLRESLVVLGTEPIGRKAVQRTAACSKTT